MSNEKMILIPILKDKLQEEAELLFRNENLTIKFWSKLLEEIEIDSSRSIVISFFESKVVIGLQAKKGADAFLLVETKSSGLNLDTLAYLSYLNIKSSFRLDVLSEIDFSDASPTQKYLEKYDMESEVTISLINILIRENMDVNPCDFLLNISSDEYGNVLFNRRYLKIKEDSMLYKEGIKGKSSLKEKIKFGSNSTMKFVDGKDVYYDRLIPVKERSTSLHLFNTKILKEVEQREIAKTFSKGEVTRSVNKKNNKRKMLELAIREKPIYYKNANTGTVLSFDGVALYIESGKIDLEREKIFLSNNNSLVEKRNEIKRDLRFNGFLDKDGTIKRKYSPRDLDVITLILECVSVFNPNVYKEEPGRGFRDLKEDLPFILEMIKKAEENI